jgi:hypothetical protein
VLDKLITYYLNYLVVSLKRNMVVIQDQTRDVD